MLINTESLNKNQKKIERILDLKTDQEKLLGIVESLKIQNDIILEFANTLNKISESFSAYGEFMKAVENALIKIPPQIEMLHKNDKDINSKIQILIETNDVRTGHLNKLTDKVNLLCKGDNRNNSDII